ncbi:TatD DNase family protein [Pseudohyphozyma bogoriensis]|nr:TatD DNase family protein [Pseudohyphozyma bogoriensis]
MSTITPPTLVGEFLCSAYNQPPALADLHPSYRLTLDIGSNLTDGVFHGNYHGKQAHPSDFAAIISRAEAAGVRAQILTGDTVPNALKAIKLAEGTEGLYATAGVHPCQAGAFDKYEGGPEKYLEELAKVIEENRGGKHGEGKVVAVGECGLDFDRLEWCSKEVQMKYFPPQLELASRFDLPLFLHSRAAHKELVEILRAHPKPLRGVVHSHTGSLEEALEYIEMGFYVGIKCV